jgi:hypothetical protein
MRIWAEHEIKFLAEQRLKMTNRQMGAALGRTEAAIRHACWLPETGRYAIWIIAKDGPVQFNEVTGFLGRLKYIATVVMRDGYYLVR